MKKASKVLSLLLAGLMAVSLTACGGSTTTSSSTAANDTSTAESTADSGETTAPAGDIDTSQAVEITMLVLGNKPTNGRMEAAIAEENKLLQESLNATLKLQYIEWADWQTQYQLALASGDATIDLIITATDWLFAWPLAKKGAFLALDEGMLSTYAPKTWAAVTPNHWEECTMGGNIWFIPEDQYSQWTNHGLFYRKDWATEAGLDKINSFTDLGTYFAGVKENHPEAYPWDIGGANNLGGLTGGYITDNSSLIHMMGTNVGNFEYFYYDTSDPYTVKAPWMESDVVYDLAKLMKEWGDAGYWREDVLNYQAETRDLMYAGSSGADQHHTQTYIGIHTTMEEQQPGADLQFFIFGRRDGNYARDLITHGAMAVSATSKNPERALMVYDQIRNDKATYRFHNYGIEGVDYIDNGDGTFSRPEGWDSTIDNLDTNFWGGRMDEFQLDDTRTYAGKDELFKDLSDNCVEYALSKFVFDPTPVQAELSAMADVCATNIPGIAYGKAGDGQAAIDSFRSALTNAGHDKVIAEIQKQLDELKASEG